MNRLGNLTLILNSYACDKGCPFCIAKNNKKFIGKDDSIENLDALLKQLNNINMHFDRFVISGNGEPSLYSVEGLQQIITCIKKYNQMFSSIRLHTSGNIFFNKEKLLLFKNAFRDNLEIDFLRVALNSNEDMQYLGYSRDYVSSDLFNEVNNIKMDIALTRILQSQNLGSKLDDFLIKHPNIRTVRFKKLMKGENENSPQANWVQKYSATKNHIIDIASNLIQYYDSSTYTDFKTFNDVSIKFEKTGNYEKDIVISNGILQGYDEQELSIQELMMISERVQEDRFLEL